MHWNTRQYLPIDRYLPNNYDPAIFLQHGHWTINPFEDYLRFVDTNPDLDPKTNLDKDPDAVIILTDSDPQPNC